MNKPAMNYKDAVVGLPPVSPVHNMSHAPPPGFTAADDARALLSLLEQRIEADPPKGPVDVVEAPLPRGGTSDVDYVRRCLSEVLDGMVTLAAVLLRMERRLDDATVTPGSTHDDTR